MKRAWLHPISDDKPDARLHLVLTEGGPLVNAVCGRMVNLQFATEKRGVKHCSYCESGKVQPEALVVVEA